MYWRFSLKKNAVDSSDSENSTRLKPIITVNFGFTEKKWKVKCRWEAGDNLSTCNDSHSIILFEILGGEKAFYWP